MEKLINKFVDKCMSLRTFDISLPGIIKQQEILEKELAEECKKVAIAFMNYVYTIEHTLLEETDEEIFNKFIEEEYEK
jgi:hypothetical protein